MDQPLKSEADHRDYLLDVLFSLRVVSEERFDRIATEHLARYRLADRLKPIKEAMLLAREAHRLELRGRAYLCRTRLAGVTDDLGRPTVTACDVVQLLDRLAAEADRLDPPRRPGKVSFYD